MAMIPQVREWIVRSQYGADLRPTRFRVLAPTRMLAVMNLRAAGNYGVVTSCGVARKPVGQTEMVVKEDA